VPWLVEHQPHLARAGGKRSPTSQAAALEPVGIDGLPGLAVPPELLALLTAGPARVTPAVVQGFTGGTFTIAHRNVLVNFVARCRVDVLESLAEALRGLDAVLASGGLALSLADLAVARAQMLDELERG
jgi:hypothetical protein